jgi:bifunctional non-homologous end joining protein LigD
MSPQAVEVEIGGRHLKLSNLDKVLWPGSGFTKGQMIDYYAKIAPVMIPHLAGRPITFVRFPDGVEGPSFFEKNCPSYRPPWMSTVKLRSVNHCQLTEPAALVWAANLAAIELHPGLAGGPDLNQADLVVFDLDPGPGTDVLTCASLALDIRSALESLGLQSWVKTSGSKGLQLYIPVEPTPYEVTKNFCRAVAQAIERTHHDLVVTTMAKVERKDRIFIDWSQNSLTKTTVAAYSLRARARPTVSTPLRWEELEHAVDQADASLLVFEADQVLQRVSDHGDLFEPLVGLRQRVPALGG